MTAASTKHSTSAWSLSLYLLSYAYALPLFAQTAESAQISLRFEQQLNPMPHTGHALPNALHSALSHIAKKHQLVAAAQADLERSQAQIQIEQSALWPRLYARTGVGNQRHEFNNQDYGLPRDTREITVGINQLVSDFGITRSAIRRADELGRNASLTVTLQEQSVLLSALDAYINLSKWQALLALSESYVARIETIAQLESQRIAAGNGFLTDLENANSQRAAAQARHLSLQNQLTSALQRYRSFFNDSEPGALPSLDQLNLHIRLPGSQAEFISQAETHNPNLQIARNQILVREIESTQGKRREIMPRLELQAEHNQRDNAPGNDGRSRTQRVMLNLNWNFELGMRWKHQGQAGESSIAAERQRTDWTRTQVTTEAARLWQTRDTLQARAQALNEQIQHAENYLALANIEREFGKRNLIDVLNGELNLINGRSEALHVQAEHLVLLCQMANLLGDLAPNTAHHAETKQTASLEERDLTPSPPLKLAREMLETARRASRLEQKKVE
jgi:adhesin transport system outer membrane protein